jgi:hypothetical protein
MVRDEKCIYHKYKIAAKTVPEQYRPKETEEINAQEEVIRDDKSQVSSVSQNNQQPNQLLLENELGSPLLEKLSTLELESKSVLAKILRDVARGFLKGKDIHDGALNQFKLEKEEELRKSEARNEEIKKSEFERNTELEKQISIGKLRIHQLEEELAANKRKLLDYTSLQKKNYKALYKAEKKLRLNAEVTVKVIRREFGTSEPLSNQSQSSETATIPEDQ